MTPKEFLQFHSVLYNSLIPLAQDTEDTIKIWKQGSFRDFLVVGVFVAVSFDNHKNSDSIVFKQLVFEFVLRLGKVEI